MQTSENVYLIFSANRAGEYFGYARMAGLIPHATKKDSPLKRVAQAGLPNQPLPQPSNLESPSTLSLQYYPHSTSFPRIFPTAANSSIPIPAGRIVDDSSRGILFWEVSDPTEDNTQPSKKEDYSNDSSMSANNWTIPFKIQWLSPINKTVPFYKVRSLRNSYNKNKYLKIARDGTEIEPIVGRKLLAMFHE